MRHVLSILAQDAESWSAAGHAIEHAWIEVATRFGASLLAALYLALFLRGLVRRHRYRVVDVFREEDVEALRAAVAAAERRTVGEILPVILERSDTHPAARWTAAVVGAAAGSFLLAPWLPFERPLLLLLAQAVMGTVCYLCASLPDFQRFFMRERRATEMAQEQALQEFFRYRLHETAERTGVLLFVSLLEHRVVVLADQGIDARVDPDRWIKTTTLVLAGIERDDLRGGIVDGIQSIADVLVEHFPWADGDRDEIPNRVIVRRE